MVRDGTGALKRDWLPRTTSQVNQVTPFELLPIAEMPNATNPTSGYIANANNDPVGTTLDNNALNQNRPGGGVYYLNARYADFRMGRVDRLIKAKLDADVKVSLTDMRQWQADRTTGCRTAAPGAADGIRQRRGDRRLVATGRAARRSGGGRGGGQNPQLGSEHANRHPRRL